MVIPISLTMWLNLRGKKVKVFLGAGTSTAEGMRPAKAHDKKERPFTGALLCPCGNRRTQNFLCSFRRELFCFFHLNERHGAAGHAGHFPVPFLNGLELRFDPAQLNQFR